MKHAMINFMSTRKINIVIPSLALWVIGVQMAQAQEIPCRNCTTNVATEELPASAYYCARPLEAVISGFLVTLATIMVDEYFLGWSRLESDLYVANPENEPYEKWTLGRLHIAFLYGPLHPARYMVELITWVYRNSYFSEHISTTVSKQERDAARILEGCPVMLTLDGQSPNFAEIDKFERSHSEYIPLDELPYMRNDSRVYLESFTVGSGKREAFQKYKTILLNNRGKEALFRAKLVPPYRQLRFAQGYSAVYILIIGMQSLGYLSAVIVRMFNRLSISPVESLGSMIAALVLLRSVLYLFASRGVYAIQFHLDATEEERLLEASLATDWPPNGYSQHGNERLIWPPVLALFTLFVVATYSYLWFSFLKHSVYTAIPAILFLVHWLKSMLIYVMKTLDILDIDSNRAPWSWDRGLTTTPPFLAMRFSSSVHEVWLNIAIAI
ncbi:hypothetical protein AXG93_793s1090 [Marchantia polymorpha subsp. ruderalis]|uniref:Uncharacterized protein n=1 Tax=Marchantia polymorpha subsp. ruderalis TaxID=1480154 RepID=A0A176W0T0_MARPO|nr:hypothetical protein AXG93_793s1090 [Marchantia polymorpha subsp. ruderalis]